MGHDVSGNLQLFENLFVTFKDLDGVPALLLFGHVVNNSLFDVGNRMLDRAGERVHRNGLGVLCSVDGGLRGGVDAGALQSGDLDDLAAKLTGKLVQVDLVAVLLDDIHHVDRHDHGDAELGQLRGEVQVALKVRAVDDVENDVRALRDEIRSGDDLFQRVGGQRVDTGKVLNDDIVMLAQTAFLFFYRDARPVTDILVGTGQSVEQRRFAAVRVAREGNSDFFFHSSSPLRFCSEPTVMTTLVFAYAISMISASFLRSDSS